MKQKPGVMIYFDIIPVLDLLSNNDAGILFRAILQYGEKGVLPELDQGLALVWPLIRQRLDCDATRYQTTVMKRKYAAYARWERQNDREPMSYTDWLEQHGYETDHEADQNAFA